MYISINDHSKDWKDYTFILPCVSVGNFGQLTADLIIATLGLKRVGYIYHESILPLIGNDPFANTTKTCQLTTSCEVYEDSENKLLVMQQRAPFAKGKRKSFVSWLTNWVTQHNFHQVVILTSSFAEERLDIQIQGSQFRCVTSEKMDKSLGEYFRSSLGWQDLEKRVPPAEFDRTGGQQGVLYMPGSGIAKQIYENLKADTSIVILLMFCSEGDNAHDAFSMATQLNKWLGMVTLQSTSGDRVQSREISEWKIPLSWRLVFGTRAEQTLFH